MKKGLLFLFLVVSSIGFGQKRMTTYSFKYYLDSAMLHDIDSTQYYYTNWYGSMLENPPLFGNPFASYIPDWSPPKLAFGYTSSERHVGYVPTITIEENTLSYNTSNQLTTSEMTSGSIRSLFSYNPNGLVSEIVFESNGTGPWVEYHRFEYEYDQVGRLTRQYNEYPFYNSYRIDSIFYQGNSSEYNRLVRYRSTDNITYNQDSETSVTFNGTEQVQANYYKDQDNNPQTPLNWLYRGNYTWNSGLLTTLDLYIISNGNLPSSPDASFNYTYNSANYPLTKSEAVSSQTILTYNYDNDVFITSIVSQGLTVNQNWYTDRLWEYSYESTLDVPKTPEIKLNVYPNPSADIVFIESDQVQSIQVYNNQGQLVLSQDNVNKISIGHLPAASYQIVVTTPQGISTATIVKKI